MQPSLHSTLEAIVRFPHDPLSADEAGHVLGRNGATISAACKLGEITCTQANYKGQGNRRAYRITKANLIEWLWRNESGDKALLRAAMADFCPRILKALEAKEAPTAAKPRNVLPFAHPDLFRDLPAPRQSA